MVNSASFGRESSPYDKPPKIVKELTAKPYETLPPISGTSAETDNGMRRQVGRLVVDIQQTIDSNLTLFRVGLFIAVAASIAVSVKVSGLLNRFNSAEEIPSWQFSQQSKLRVRLIRQSRQDPSVFYVYHTPFLRRTVLQDKLPHTIVSGIFREQQESELIAIRPFGVQVDESSEEWVWSNVVSSHRSLTIQLLQRMKVEGSGSVALCHIALKRPPLTRDFAQELVSRGYAECIPVNLKSYESGLNTQVTTLAQRLKNLEVAQKRAQTMQYGIWKNWQEEKLSDRVFSASKRAAARGFKKLVSRINP